MNLILKKQNRGMFFANSESHAKRQKNKPNSIKKQGGFNDNEVLS
jgi:hypothetical protein